MPGRFFSFIDDEPEATFYISLEHLPLGDPSVRTDLPDCRHGPADHSHGIIGGNGTQTFHLFDDVAAAIGGRRRRPVNSLA
jgi:hypothetical protein